MYSLFVPCKMIVKRLFLVTKLPFIKEQLPFKSLTLADLRTDAITDEFVFMDVIIRNETDNNFLCLCFAKPCHSFFLNIPKSVIIDWTQLTPDVDPHEIQWINYPDPFTGEGDFHFEKIVPSEPLPTLEEFFGSSTPKKSRTPKLPIEFKVIYRMNRSCEVGIFNWEYPEEDEDTFLFQKYESIPSYKFPWKWEAKGLRYTRSELRNSLSWETLSDPDDKYTNVYHCDKEDRFRKLSAVLYSISNGYFLHWSKKDVHQTQLAFFAVVTKYWEVSGEEEAELRNYYLPAILSGKFDKLQEFKEKCSLPVKFSVTE